MAEQLFSYPLKEHLQNPAQVSFRNRKDFIKPEVSQWLIERNIPWNVNHEIRYAFLKDGDDDPKQPVVDWTVVMRCSKENFILFKLTWG